MLEIALVLACLVLEIALVLACLVLEIALLTGLFGVRDSPSTGLFGARDSPGTGLFSARDSPGNGPLCAPLTRDVEAIVVAGLPGCLERFRLLLFLRSRSSARRNGVRPTSGAKKSTALLSSKEA